MGKIYKQFTEKKIQKALNKKKKIPYFTHKKCKLKLPWTRISHLSDGQKSRSWISITLSVVEVVRKQALVYVANQSVRGPTPYGGTVGNLSLNYILISLLKLQCHLELALIIELVSSETT